MAMHNVKFNPRTYRRSGWWVGGGGMLPLPSEVFLTFPWKMFVFPSRAFSDGQSKWLRDIKSNVARWSKHFCVKMHVISVYLYNKSKACG